MNSWVSDVQKELDTSYFYKSDKLECILWRFGPAESMNNFIYMSSPTEVEQYA